MRLKHANWRQCPVCGQAARKPAFGSAFSLLDKEQTFIAAVPALGYTIDEYYLGGKHCCVKTTAYAKTGEGAVPSGSRCSRSRGCSFRPPHTSSTTSPSRLANPARSASSSTGPTMLILPSRLRRHWRQPLRPWSGCLRPTLSDPRPFAVSTPGLLPSSDQRSSRL